MGLLSEWWIGTRRAHPGNPGAPGKTVNRNICMIAMITPMFAAIGFSIIYLLLGGGLGGAVLIFIIAKMLGR
jgi:hypothetical protein